MHSVLLKLLVGNLLLPYFKREGELHVIALRDILAVLA
jgi:hypothetical protein